MKGRVNAGGINRGFILRRSGANSGGRDWSKKEAKHEQSESRSLVVGDIRSVEGLRNAINGTDKGRGTSEILLVAGAILLAITTIVTLIITAQINARANRLLENETIRARESVKVVERLEAKLDSGISTVEDNNRKLDELRLAIESTSTTSTVPPPVTTVPRAVLRSPIPPVSPPPAVPPVPSRTPPTTAYTAPIPNPQPCSLLIIVICIKL